VSADRDRDGALADLVRRARAGDGSALGALYDRYAERVYRYALAHVREPGEAEDLMQRVFLKMIEALPAYEDRGLPFDAWLFRIARNAAIDAGRTRRAWLPLEVAEGRPDARLEPAEAAERTEEQALIRAALASLSPDQRDVVTLRFFGGLSHAEIGAVLGKREATVRGLQFRGLNALRSRLSPAAGTERRAGRVPA
jgi:RNA polymerase sigma-70 factor (ECF subfamily)